MEGGSVSGETSPDTEKTSMTGLSGKKCPEVRLWEEPQQIKAVNCATAGAIFFGFLGGSRGLPHNSYPTNPKVLPIQKQGETNCAGNTCHQSQKSSVRMLARFRAARCWLAGSDPGCSVFVRCLGYSATWLTKHPDSSSRCAGRMLCSAVRLCT